MITKLKSNNWTENPSTIEFEKIGQNLVVQTIELKPYDETDIHTVELSADQLFDLIGVLLRIQSQFKAGL